MNIIRVQITAIAIGLTLTLGSMAGAAALQNQTNNQAQTDQAQVQERNDFYNEIAGLLPGDSLDASDKLGIALNNRFEDVSNEDEFDQVVEEFVASSRDYPGITEQIGFNPFSPGGRSCDECGELSPEMVSQLRVIILDENVESLITSVDEVDTTITTTLFGMPIWLQLVAVWQIAGGVGLMYGIHKYGDRKLTFKRDGYADGYEATVVALAPLAFVVYQFGYNRKMQKRIEQHDLQIIDDAGLLGPLSEINATLESFDALPAGDRDREVIETIDALTRERERILSYPAKLADRTIADPSRRVLRANAQAVLDAARVAIDAHDAAVDEVQSFDHTN